MSGISHQPTTPDSCRVERCGIVIIILYDKFRYSILYHHGRITPCIILLAIIIIDVKSGIYVKHER